MMIDTLNFHKISHNNLIGFAADTTNSMMGDKRSVSSFLNNYFSGITIFKCICHSIHLCASEAAKELPRSSEELIRNIYSHFSMSAKRSNEFANYQVLADVRPHKLLHPSQTRWLSLNKAVQRLVEQWPHLRKYFNDIEPIERLTSITRIVKDMNDPSIFLILNFLKDMLPILSRFNLLFQNETPTVHLVHSTVTEIYELILGYFCHRYLIDRSPLDSFDPANKSNHVPINNIYLGSTVHTLLQKEEYFMKVDMVKYVRNRCLDYLVKLCQEIKKRFHMSDPLLKMISFFHPKKLLD